VAMSVPIDRPLKLHESFFLNDAAITLAAVHPGNLLVFSSAALCTLPPSDGGRRAGAVVDKRTSAA
jgi:hypothetical protein